MVSSSSTSRSIASTATARRSRTRWSGRNRWRRFGGTEQELGGDTGRQLPEHAAQVHDEVVDGDHPDDPAAVHDRCAPERMAGEHGDGATDIGIGIEDDDAGTHHAVDAAVE